MKAPKTNTWSGLDRSVQTSAPDARAAAGIQEFDPRQFLEHLIAPGDTLPRKTRERLRAAARAYAADPAAATFDKFLGFTGAPSERSWATRAAQAEMDRYLLEAWRTFGDEASKWRRGQDLGAEIGVFKEVQWPAWKSRDAPPDDATPLRAALFLAAKAVDGRLPEDWRAIRASVQRAQAAACS